MDTRATQAPAFSVSVPGIELPVRFESPLSERLPGLLSNLTASYDNGILSYSESQLCGLLGETAPIVHPNLNKTVYMSRLERIFVERSRGPSSLRFYGTAALMLGAVGSAAIYKYGIGFPWSLRGSAVVAALLFIVGATLSCFSAMEKRSDGGGKESYPYLDLFAGGPSHIKWKEYWRTMMIERCDRKKLSEVADRAKEFHFRMRHLRKPSFTTKDDGTQLSGDDIWKFMIHNEDTGFAAITSLLWSAEAARRASGTPLREKMGASPANAKFFLKFAKALSGREHVGLSLPQSYSQPFVDLLDSASYYVGLANQIPTHAAALSAFLARYYYDRNQRNNASLMMQSMHYVLQGKWRAAFSAHLAAMSRPVSENVPMEQKAVNAIHLLGIARLMHERMIDVYDREIGLGAYSYASSAARAFNVLAGEIEKADMHWEILEARALDIMRVMTDNGPFVEFR